MPGCPHQRVDNVPAPFYDFDAQVTPVFNRDPVREDEFPLAGFGEFSFVFTADVYTNSFGCGSVYSRPAHDYNLVKNVDKNYITIDKINSQAMSPCRLCGQIRLEQGREQKPYKGWVCQHDRLRRHTLNFHLQGSHIGSHTSLV